MSETKFFIVLDGILEINEDDWNPLKAALRDGVRGSKILITTQNQYVAKITGSIYTLSLDCLSNDDCRSLFEEKAFPCGRSCGNLEEILEKVDTKCRGVPLVARTLGHFFNSKTYRHDWDAILESDLWSILGVNNDIFRALSSSYLKLPTCLKQLLAYSSIIPKGHKFDKDKLVHLWMAEGFIKPEGFVQQQGSIGIENLGYDYFNDLASRSFIQCTDTNQSSNEGSDNQLEYEMHHVVHDFAYFISQYNCLKMENLEQLERLSSDIRHLSLLCKNRREMALQAINEVGNIRTILRRCQHTPVIHEVYSLDRGFENLRVLDLSDTSINALPEFIGCLKQLLHLDLSRTYISSCKEICRLSRLQCLKLMECPELRTLPEMEELTSLRHLHLDQTPLLDMPRNIGRITSLETLSHFIVGSEEENKIGELKGMAAFKGSLHISKLEHVNNAEEASDAALVKKELRELTLEWSERQNYQSPNVADEVLDNLQPYEKIKELHILGFGGSRPPTWMVQPDFSNLLTVFLHGFKNCKFLPPLGQLPYLQSLGISKMDFVTEMGAYFGKRRNRNGREVPAFPSLLMLKFEDMPRWKRWDGVKEDDFPRLVKLTITKCPVLEGLPTLKLKDCMKAMILCGIEGLKF
ncbi:PREDICTED: putative disease resistance RPP13-like protein 1 [Nelumbo nucifera]|uniref:Disease resistance RPP13-like protein 1 n=2 Tax=Nelumbo nucifera TaxID=4432 RepID=A0A1U8A3J7_NELNU|nr:PREDICTED: putative disease resistance RPP13-like protein 1 [Nelumbo nucifera]DAD39315.1 TPA_asm: hypothetical protein HUJ06_013638 [Nelumbo nucifera]